MDMIAAIIGQLLWLSLMLAAIGIIIDALMPFGPR